MIARFTGLQGNGLFCGHVPVHCEAWGISGVWSIFSIFFGNWQQHCSFWLSVLQQVIVLFPVSSFILQLIKLNMTAVAFVC